MNSYELYVPNCYTLYLQLVVMNSMYLNVIHFTDN